MIYVDMVCQQTLESKTYEIYNALWAQTGQAQDKLPLRIVDKPIINAYNDGNEIVVYTGLLKSTNSWDEIALLLGHEIAHGTLGHLKMLNTPGYINSDLEVAILEGNADKLGSVYMMRAGYDICKGREMFKTWKDNNGDYQGGNHPGYGYRYSELRMPWCHDD